MDRLSWCSKHPDLPPTQAGLPGFYDPCVGEEKSLRVLYQFRGVLHQVTAPDSEALRIPKQCEWPRAGQEGSGGSVRDGDPTASQAHSAGGLEAAEPTNSLRRPLPYSTQDRHRWISCREVAAEALRTLSPGVHKFGRGNPEIRCSILFYSSRRCGTT